MKLLILKYVPRETCTSSVVDRSLQVCNMKCEMIIRSSVTRVKSVTSCGRLQNTKYSVKKTTDL